MKRSLLVQSASSLPLMQIDLAVHWVMAIRQLLISSTARRDFGWLPPLRATPSSLTTEAR
jgi:hypothetical protein